MIEKIPHKKKTIALGTLAAVVVFATPHVRTTIKWINKMDETRSMAKANKEAIVKLAECERKDAEEIVKLETQINAMGRRIDRLEYRIDNP